MAGEHGDGAAARPARFRVETHEALASTQDAMRDRLSAGEDVDGLVIRALAQTGGRGRRGNAWLSAAGGSYQTAAWRYPDTPSADGPLTTFLPLALALGVSRALDEAGARVLVKWPNDLMLGERKLGGLLVERTAGHVLVGAGLNVDNPVPDDFAALRGWAVEAVGDLVIEGFGHGVELMAGPASAALAVFDCCDWLAGRSLTVESAGRVISGIAAGVDAAGCLLLKSEEALQGRTRACAGHVAYASSRPAAGN